MYEERKNKFSIKDFIIQLILVILFVLAMIWLFPTKNYLEDNYVGEGNLKENLSSLYNRVFADNVESMRDAAKGYFTTQRLPKKIGDSVTITLSEMLDKKLILPFKDSNNESCDLNKSFVELVKMDNEYQMKVQLSCSDFSDYILVYMGCYDYCDSDICEEQPEVKPTTPTNKPSVKPQPTKNYMYEYMLSLENTYSKWSDWSDWSTNIIESNDLREVETEVRDVFSGYNKVWDIIGYEEKTVTTYENKTTQVQTGTEKKQVGTEKQISETKTLTETAVYNGDVYSDWVYQGYVTFNYAVSTYVSSTSTVKYVYISDKTVIDCSNVCANVTQYTYKKYTRTVSKGGYSCASYGSDWELNGIQCTKTVTEYKEVPIYEEVPVYEDVTEQVEVNKTVNEPVYGYVLGTPKYKQVTYYRYRTREQLTIAGINYKWSSKKDDKTLLDNGYTLTGNSKEV